MSAGNANGAVPKLSEVVFSVVVSPARPNQRQQNANEDSSQARQREIRGERGDGREG